jgi:hypothetical protein
MACFFIWRPLLIFIIPGVLIFFIEKFKKIGLSEKIAYTIGISLSFWICSFWALRYIRISFTSIFYFSLAVSFLTIAYFSFKNRNPEIKTNWKEVLIVLIFIAVLFLFISITRNQIVAAGADMSMHTYIAKLIYEKNSFPLSYNPILPIDHFGAYSTGLQSISALISLLSGIPVYRAALLMTGITYFLFFAFLYAFLRRFYNPLVSVMASLIVTFAGRQPIEYVSWGGNPSIMSMSFVILGLSLIYLLKRKSWLNSFLISLVFCASFFTNFVPFLVFAYFYIGIFIFDFFKSKSRRSFVLRHLCIFLISLLIISPFIFNLGFENVSNNEKYRNKEREYPTNNPALWNGNIKNAIKTIPEYVINYDGKFIFLLAFIGLFFTFILNRNESLKQFSIILIIFLLVLNSHYWIIPLSYVLIPYRIATMALIPVAFFIAGLIMFSFKTFFENVMKKEFSAKILGLCALISIILISVACFQNSVSRYSFFLRSSESNSMVTDNDIAAFEWIIANTEQDDLFLNNYGDAGAWIPAIAFRPAIDIHNTPSYFDEFNKGIKDLELDYAYIGSKKVYRINIKPEDFDSEPEKYKLVFSQGDARIYKIIQ